MKNKIFTGIIATMLLICITSCGISKDFSETSEEIQGTSESGSTEETTTLSATETENTDDVGQPIAPQPLPLKKVSLSIADNQNMKYRIVYSSKLSSESVQAVQKFASDINTKIGIAPQVVADNIADISEYKEIYINYVSAGVSAHPENYGEYGIKVYDDSNISIYGQSADMLNEAFSKFADSIEKSQNGEYTYEALEHEKYSSCELLSSLPFAEFGISKEVYEQHENVYQINIYDVMENDLEKYKVALRYAGYMMYSQNQIDKNNIFITYKKFDAIVHISYRANNKSMMLVVEKDNYIPLPEPKVFIKRAEPTITQLKTEVNGGMGYVIQLADGKFVIVDGGVTSADAAKELMQLLDSKNSRTGYVRPKVTWMFTHSHDDHIALALNFLSVYSDRIDLELVCANFLELDSVYAQSITDASGSQLLEDVLKTKFPTVAIFNFHSGQALHLAGCRIDFYFTYEDIYPNRIVTLNSASAAWKFTFDKGQTFMILGDITDECAEIMDIYYADTLKSDIMQATHHGTSTGARMENIKELYSYISPHTVMWANCEVSRVESYPANSVLFSKQGLVSIYATQSTTVSA